MKSTSTTIGRALTSALALLTVVTNADGVRGQHSSADAAPTVQRAAFNRAESGDSRETVRFTRRTPRVGDEIEQKVTLEVRLNTSLRQGNELVEKNSTAVRSAQRRLVTSTDLDGDRTTAVQVRYLEATRQLRSDSAEFSPPTVQPVQGKTYRCRRAPGEEGQLLVTDPEDRVPPAEELEIVAQNMEMVGRPNPLVEFLAGRTIATGETVELPKDLADQLFMLGDRFGKVARFDLTLERMEMCDGAACAVFSARVEAASNDSSQMRMQVEGPLVIQIESCRAVRLSLSGPIGMSETRGSYSTVYQLLGTGHLKMSIESTYRDAGS